MVSYHRESAQHYNETMENLKIINETIAYLLQVAHLTVFVCCCCCFFLVVFFSRRSQILIATLKILSVARIVSFTLVFNIKRLFYR